MSKYNEQDFSRLRKDKDFANEVLLFRTSELLIGAVELYLNDPTQKDNVVNSISYAVEKHLNSKNKFKVIHDIYKEIRKVTVIKRLMPSNNNKIENFIRALDSTLQWIEDKEEGKIQEREEILMEMHQKAENIILYNTLTGFQTTLTDEEIRIHHDKLIKGGYIDKSTKLINYTAVFRDLFLPDEFIPVKWILLTPKKKPHKTALREFLTLALGKAPDQKTINICFTDRNGSIIKLAKPKRNEFSNYYKDFEELFKH